MVDTSVQDYCKPLFETLKQMISTSNKQVYALSSQVSEMTENFNTIGKEQSVLQTQHKLLEADI